ncbi:hypothetical protein CF327_g4807 [Tilletia walkeri]|nr:hypothetical protein CF327_g4807 [Tilletia walkeri]
MAPALLTTFNAAPRMVLLNKRATAYDDDSYCSFGGCGLGVGARAGIIAGIIVCLIVLGTLVAGVRRRRLQRMHETIYVQQAQNQQNGAGNPYAAGAGGGYPPQANRPQNQWYAGPPPGTPPVDDSPYSPYAPPYGYKAPEAGAANGLSTPSNAYPPPQGPPPAMTASTDPHSSMPSPAVPPTSPPSTHPTGGNTADSSQPATNTASSDPVSMPMPSVPEPAMHAHHTGNTSAIPSVPPPAYQPNEPSAPNTSASNNNTTTI